MNKSDMLESLINYYTDGNKAKFSSKIGVKPQTVSAWLSRNTFDTEILYANCEGVSADWLLTGRGDMLDSSSPAQEKSEKENINDYSLPYFHDYYFGCSPSGFMEAITKGKATSFITLPGLVNDGDTFVVPARGDSMINASNPDRSIPNGSLVAVRKTRLSSPRWGEVYALATSDGCIIKRLYPSDRDGFVKCVSFNTEEYPPFELESSEIYDIGIVVAVVNVAVWS